MATSPLNRVIQHLRRGVRGRDGGGLTDGELLECFIAERDEATFEALLTRHGPMVMGVCRRVIGNAHDAEDAFQATFLVLVRKAASIVPRQAVGNWLYGVAYRTALEARGRNNRRHAKEIQVTDMPQPKVQPDGLWQDLQPLLDRELNRLPDKYRVPLVLCELEGRTRKEVAHQLSVPEGTLSSRLATARSLLAKRLSGRGLAVSAAALTTLFSQNAVSACVPAPLLVSTAKAAALLAAGQTAAGVISIKVAALTEGVLKAMLVTKIKTTAVFLLVVGMVALGGGTLVHTLAGTTADRPQVVAQNDVTPLFFEEETAQEAAQAQRQPKGGGTVAGKLEAIDAGKNTVTIKIPNRQTGPVDKTFDLAKDIAVVQDGRAGKLDALKKGSQVTLKLSADEKAVVSIVAGTPPMSAPLKSVDAAKNTITLTVGSRAAKEDKIYQVAKDAKITIDGKEAKLSDLKAGTMLTLAIADGNTVTEVRTVTRRDRKQEE